ncbi:MAG: GldG family protein [candidate division NC10 bacterium]|nr:GldG family protein [candidate division NC10 bacterium]
MAEGPERVTEAVARRRRTAYALNTALAILLLFGIVALVEALSYRHNRRFDLTEGRRQSLSDQSIKVLRGLTQPVKAVGFSSPERVDRASLEDLLRLYAYHSDRFTFELIDLDRSPATARRYGVTTPNTVVVESGAREEKVLLPTEEKVTNALLKVTREARRVVYFLQGHGEGEVNNTDRPGFSQARDAIQGANYEVKELLLLRERDVPADAAVLVVAGPKREPLPAEVAALERYVQRGGKLLVLLDPEQAPALAVFLEKHGVRPGQDVIVDRLSRVLGGDYLIPVVTQYESHPITREFTLASFFPYARTVDAAASPPEGVTVQVLARTGEGSWAETDREALRRGEARFDAGKDRRGPVPVGAVATVEVKSPAKKGEAKAAAGTAVEPASEPAAPRKARIVAYGTAAFASNNYLNLSGNRDLFLNTIAWLAEEEDLISIRPREAKFTPVILTAGQGQAAFWIGVVVPPAVALLAGVAVGIRRRRAR